jgi:stage III sporulation protein AC
MFRGNQSLSFKSRAFDSKYQRRRKRKEKTISEHGSYGRYFSRNSIVIGGNMDVSLIFKIAAVGILVSILSQVLKHSGREEQAFLTSLAGLILVLFWIVPYIYELFETIQRLFEL